MLVFPQIEGQEKSGVLFYSVKGPGAMHAPLLLALIVGLGIGFLAQRSRFCTMGAIRDMVLFGQIHLLTGFIGLVVFAFLTNCFWDSSNRALRISRWPTPCTSGISPAWPWPGLHLPWPADAPAGSCFSPVKGMGMPPYLCWG